MLKIFDLMNQGKVNGYIAQGFNPLASLANSNNVRDGLKKLKFLVIMDPLVTETSEFWKNHGEYNDVDPASIQTEVFRLPTTCFAEEDGAIVSSSRVLQWHWKAADAPGEAKTDITIMSALHLRLKKLYAQEGGKFPDPIANLYWPYAQAAHPSSEEIAKEYNGRALVDLTDAEGKVIRKAGEQLAGFGEMRADGSTLGGCWIWSGCWTSSGNQMARRDNSDPTGIGNTLNWAWAWPANRRVLYNRASCDRQGKPFDPDRVLVQWNGSRWVGADVPDVGPTLDPETVNPFIMNPEGVARFFSRKGMNEGPFPTHYEAFRQPAGLQPDVPEERAGRHQPGRADSGVGQGHGGRPEGVPARGHQLPPDRALPLLDQARAPEQHRAAGAVCGNWRGTGQRAGHRNGRTGQGQLQARLCQGGGGRDQAHEAHADRRQDHPPRGRAHPLGLCLPGAQGAHGQQLDGICGRWQQLHPPNPRPSS